MPKASVLSGEIMRGKQRSSAGDKAMEAGDPHGVAVFLSGPIGAGKTSLGRGLARRIDGVFIDGDDHRAPDRPWYGSSLSTSRMIARAAFGAADAGRPAVIAYPLRARNWIFYSQTLARAGMRSIFVTLHADYDAIIDARRGRSFSEGERRRIRTMIEEGYGRRGFSDLFIDTGAAGFCPTLDRLTRDVEHEIVRSRGIRARAGALH